jgi:transmembrane serine protease 3
MKQFVLTIFFCVFWATKLASGAAIPTGTCGKSAVPFAQSITRALKGNSTQRIVGGFEANRHSIPWIVSIRNYDNFHYCGGSLIRTGQAEETNIVVTAAHCITDPTNLDNPDFQVVAGAHAVSETADGEQRVPAAKVVMHQDYDTQTIANDIAIIKLSRPVKFSQTIQPFCLPPHNYRVPAGTKGTVAGWGYMRHGGDPADKLQQVVVPVTDHETCNAHYGYRLNEATQICPYNEDAVKFSCNGDSGGPYFFEGANGYTLQGLVSYGQGCADPHPKVYTRISAYIPWIQEQIQALTAA